MIHHSVLVDVSSKILNGKDCIMYEGITVASINPYAFKSLINQVIFDMHDKINYFFKEFSRKYGI